MARKQMSFKESIRRTFILYALVPAILLGIVSFVAMRWLFYNSIKSGCVTDSTRIANNLQQVCSTYQQLACDIASDPATLLSIQRGQGGIAISQKIYEAVNGQKTRCRFYLLGANGRAVLSSTASLPGYLTRPLYNVGVVKKAMESPDQACLSVESPANDSRSVLAVGKAVLNGRVPVGILVFEMDERDFIGQFQAASAEEVFTASQHNYICWGYGSAFSDRYGKLLKDFQGENGRVVALNTDFFVSSVSILDGELTVYAISKLAGYQELFLTAGLILALVFLVLMVCMFGVARRVADEKTAVVDQVVSTMNLARDGEFDTPLVIHTGDEFEQIAVSYNQMLGDIHQLMDDKQELARQSALSQIQQLEAQFNPHFLFNTLELIKYMSRIAPDKAGDVIVGLSNLLRDSLDNSISKVTLQQDVEYTKNYLLIQKYRFGDKLAYDFDIAPEASRCMVPKRTIQPLVENSVTHGAKFGRCCTVHIRARVESDKLYITVEDNGNGIQPQQLEQLRAILRQQHNTTEHNGIYNVHRRIGLIYGEQYGLSLESCYGEGTTAQLVMPAQPEGPEDDQSTDR